MRLAELLSKKKNETFVQIEGFLDNRRLRKGKQKKLNVGTITLNFFCRNCNDIRTFSSNAELFCIGVNDNEVSIDCILECPSCHALVPVWFLVESENDIHDIAPKVRIIKCERKLSDDILSDNSYDVFSPLLDKAEIAYSNKFGAGAIIYLRLILEQVVANVADTVGISNTNSTGERKTFKRLLKEVDTQCSIVPNEFSANGYRLFRELSECIHGRCEEDVSLEKYIPLKRLVIGILDNIKNREEIKVALENLNWNCEVSNE